MYQLPLLQNMVVRLECIFFPGNSLLELDPEKSFSVIMVTAAAQILFDGVCIAKGPYPKGI